MDTYGISVEEEKYIYTRSLNLLQCSISISVSSQISLSLTKIAPCKILSTLVPLSIIVIPIEIYSFLCIIVSCYWKKKKTLFPIIILLPSTSTYGHPLLLS